MQMKSVPENFKFVRPSIFNYLHYRPFLKDFVEYLKLKNAYSARGFAKQAGLGSASYLKMILDGKRELGGASSAKIAKAFGLKILETDFFKELVKFSLEKNIKAKDKLFENLLRFKQFKEIHRLTSDAYEYFSNWKLITIYEALGTAWAKQSSQEQAASLGMSAADLESSLQILKRIQLAEFNGTRWVKSSQSFITPRETNSLMIRRFHEEMTKKALQSIDQVSPMDRSMVGITIAVSKKNKRELSQRIFEFVQEINAKYANDEAAEEVVQCNLQLFPLLQIKS